MEFIKTNPHPRGKKTGDCVVRALACAESKRWLDVYDDLYKLGREMLDMPNMKKVYEEYLKRHGWVKHKMPKHWNGKRYTVAELADENPNKEMIVSVAKHLTFVSYMELLDTWDCSKKSVGNYYIKS